MNDEQMEEETWEAKKKSLRTGSLPVWFVDWFERWSQSWFRKRASTEIARENSAAKHHHRR